MIVKGIVKIAFEEIPLAGAKVSLYVGDKELALLYSDIEGEFVYKETSQYTGNTLTCRVDKEGFDCCKQNYKIEDKEKAVPLVIKLKKIPRLLNYLPAIYQKQAEEDGDPLKTFLIAFEDCFSRIDKTIDNIDTFFDPFLTPADQEGGDFLRWLASWVSLEIDEGWPEWKKRKLIKEAHSLYEMRSTSKGLKRIIKVFLDIEVKIEEWKWPGMVIGVQSKIGLDTKLMDMPDQSHCFLVICDIKSDSNNAELIKKLRALIDLEKPAHTSYYLSFTNDAIHDCA